MDKTDFLKFNLQRRILIFFMGAIVLVALNFLFASFQESAMREDSVYVDITKKNTNAIHKAVFYARNIAEGKKSDINDLVKEIKVVDANLSLLKDGGEYLDKNHGEFYVSPTAPKIRPQLSEIEKMWQEFRKKLVYVADNPAQYDSTLMYYQRMESLTPEERRIIEKSETNDDWNMGENTSETNSESDLNALLDIDPFAPSAEEPKQDSTQNAGIEPTQEGIQEAGIQEDFVFISRTFKVLSPSMKPQLNYLIRNTEKITLFNENLANTYRLSVINNQNRLRIVLSLLWIVNIAAMFLGYIYIVSNTIKPLKRIAEIINMLADGDLSRGIIQRSKDEVGEVILSINNLSLNLEKISTFAINVGNSNFDYPFKERSEKDSLGIALMAMRDNLRKNAEEDLKRNWANEGMAKFAEILRKHNNDITLLSYHIVSNLVAYLNANQGGIFILEKEGDDEFLTLSAAYAYDKRKYFDKKVEIGQGLLGQCLLERATIHLTEIPQNYVYITSGLGEATPKSLLIVPLMVNQVPYGAMEIASLGEFTEHQINFVEKLSESIASTIASTRANERNVKLLEESQLFTEQMRAQEEEMRQNMEELTATQEEMYRVQSELTDKERNFREMISNTSMMVMAVELDYTITVINKSYTDMLKKQLGYELHAGDNLWEAMNTEQQERWGALYQRAFKGEHFHFVTNIKDIDMEDIYYLLDFNPIYDSESNRVKGASIFVKEITWLSPIRWYDKG